jgi:uncharacterized protein
MAMHNLLLDWTHPVLAVALGYLVLGITGFGSALIIVPLLAWKWPLPEAVALTLMLDVPASAWFGGLNFKQVSLIEVRRLLPGLLVGMALGLWGLSVLEPRWLLLLLGAYVIFTGLRALRTQNKPAAPAAPVWAHLAGVLIGAVQMLFGAAGPVVLAWLQRRLGDVRDLRATTPVVMVCAACAVLLCLAAAGRLPGAVLWQRWWVLIAVALAAVTLGNRLSRHLPAARLKQTICLLLVASGSMLMWRATR